MAEEQKPNANAAADEIAELKRQIEAMRKQIDEYTSTFGDANAAAPADANPSPITVQADVIDAQPIDAQPATTAENSSPIQTSDAQTAQPFVTYEVPQSATTQATAAQPSAEAPTQQGEQVPWKDEPYTAAPQPQQAAQSTRTAGAGNAYQAPYQSHQSTYQPLTHTKDHVAAGLLAVFLGSFGIHKFYLGYNTAGFILLAVTVLGGLFTFGIASSVAWLIGMVEGVIYLTKSQAEFEQTYVQNKKEWF